MAVIDYRAYKSTCFVQAANNNNSKAPAGTDMGQVTKTQQLVAGGGRVEYIDAYGNDWGVVDVYSRAGFKMNPDFSGMVSITSASLRLWHWNSSGGTLTTHGLITPQTYGSANINLGAMVTDWGEYGSYYWNKTGGFIGTGKWRNNRSGNPPWSWAAIQDFAKRTDYTHTMSAWGSYTDFDVTNIVRYWFDGNPNYGFALASVGEEYSWINARDHVTTFFSETNDSNSDWWPLLTITYSTNTPPGLPINLAPTGDVILDTTTPTLSFQLNDSDAGESITGSSVQVFNDAITAQYLQTNSYAWPGIVGSFVYGTIPSSLATPLVPGYYYQWRCQLADKAGVWSEWSAFNRFRVNATPDTPSVDVTGDLDDMQDLNPSYSWSFTDADPADSNMYYYHMQVDKLDEYGSWVTHWDTEIVDISSAPVSQITLTGTTLAWGTDYRVRVMHADSNAAWSGWSSYVYWETHKTSDPINLSPTGGTPTGYTPTFFGERYQAPDEIIAYRLWVYDADGNDYLVPTVYTGGINNKLSFSKLYDGTALTAGVTYYWRVQIESAIGGYSDYSAQQSFVVADATVPESISPTGDQQYTLVPAISYKRTAIFDRMQFQVYPTETEPTDSGVDDVGTDAHFASAYISTGITGTDPTVYSETYSGTILEWDDGEGSVGYYKIRGRVSADAGTNWSGWSGLTDFKTDGAAPPTLVAVDDDTDVSAWILSSSPYFDISANGADTIDYADIRVHPINTPQYNHWRSGYVDNDPTGINASIEFTGTGAEALVPGARYSWDASIQDATGARSGYSVMRYFRVNSPPLIPTDLYPLNGKVVPTSEDARFEATFSDLETSIGDYPTMWGIETEEMTGYDALGNEIYAAYSTVEDTGTLIAGHNSKLWDGTAFIAETKYRWRTWFEDSLSAEGSKTSWQYFTRSVPPNFTNLSPSEDSNVSTVTQTFSGTYTGSTKSSHIVTIWVTDADGNILYPLATFGPYYNSNTSQQIPVGYLRNYGDYRVEMKVFNDKGLEDPSPPSSHITVLLDAPNAVQNIDTISYPDSSRIRVTWHKDGVDAYVLKAGHVFVSYKIYRKKWYELDWVAVASVDGIGTHSWDDWYAGNSINYTYRIVAVTTKSGISILMESPDESLGGNIQSSKNDSDNWTLVGADRADGHIYDMIIMDESHNRPIQQEEFETLGADRKIIMRGFVLGHEGSLTTMWLNKEEVSPSDPQVFVNHTQIGRDLVEYITVNAGPHIIKSPFGDVWEVEFTQPEYTWLSTGHLEITLDYIEVGSTSQVVN